MLSTSSSGFTPLQKIRIQLRGAALFAFIPLVLYLFLQYPFGLYLSFALAISIIIAHRFVAIPFMDTFYTIRCLWCGKIRKSSFSLSVQSGGKQKDFRFCHEKCRNNAAAFFRFCNSHKFFLRIGIFLPLLWYLITMSLNQGKVISFPEKWNFFIFQFFIACTVVSVSLFYRFSTQLSERLSFPFPIHNLFLLGIQKTLWVFLLVGLWWITTSLYSIF